MRLRLRELERAIEETEGEISALENMLTSPEIYQDYKRMQELCAELEQKKQFHSDCLDEWAELSEAMPQ